ncbi:MAG TPA: hypothetical protein VF088_00555 [Pyrinomonadaceae bacterium]
MPNFTGLLSIIGSQSNLNSGPTNFLLIMAGISDPAQATFAATQFLVKTKNLHSGQMINVTGNTGTTGSVNIIAMTNASAAAPSPMAFTAGIAPMVGSGAKKKSKKTAKKPGKQGAKKAAKRGKKKSSKK